MAVFTYKALDGRSAALSGVISADSPRSARDKLRMRGLSVQDVQLLDKTSHEIPGLHLLFRQSPATTTLCIRELSTLLGIGMPLLEAIDLLARQHRGRFRQTLLMLRDQVEQGASLADAMRKIPYGVFDEMTIHMVEVGESGGHLDKVLEELAGYKERSLQFKNRVVSALLYPCMVIVVALVVGLFLMSFVVPKLLSSLVEAGKELPLITQVIKGLSDLITGYWWMLILGAIAAIVAMAMILATAWGRHLFHRAQLGTPVLGELLRKQAIARIALIMASLMRGGIVFLAAIDIAKRSTSNTVLRKALNQCQDAVQSGSEIGAALEKTGAFPLAMVQIFAIGQQSGRLEEMLERLANDYDRQINTATHRLTSILEPVLILIVATLVGLIAFATILPILEAGHVL